MVDLPLLSAPSLKQQMAGHRSANMTLEQLEALSAEQKAKMVLVVQDPFTSYYDAPGGGRLYPSGRGLRLSAGAPAVLAERQGASISKASSPASRAPRRRRRTSSTAWRSWACRWWAVDPALVLLLPR